MNHRVLRAVVWITLSLALMALLAYGFGSVTRTEWVWWLAPLTVGLDAILFRARVCDATAVIAPYAPPVGRGPAVPIYFVSSVVTAAVAAWAAYTGNRFALIIGATFAIVGKAFEGGER